MSTIGQGVLKIGLRERETDRQQERERQTERKKVTERERGEYLSFPDHPCICALYFVFSPKQVPPVAAESINTVLISSPVNTILILDNDNRLEIIGVCRTDDGCSSKAMP